MITGYYGVKRLVCAAWRDVSTARIDDEGLDQSPGVNGRDCGHRSVNAVRPFVAFAVVDRDDKGLDKSEAVRGVERRDRLINARVALVAVSPSFVAAVVAHQERVDQVHMIARAERRQRFING